MAWYDAWGSKCVLTVDQTMFTAGTLAYFPIAITEALESAKKFVSEALDADGAYAAQADGGDLRFYAGDYSASDPATEDTNRLALEIDDWTPNNDPAAATCELHTSVPSVSASGDTKITVYYGSTGKSQPAEGASYGKHEVWDDNGSDNFDMVQHMTGASATDLDDSTVNDNDFSSGSGGFNAVGKVGKCVQFNGSSQSLDLGAPIIPASTAFTLSFWLKYSQISVVDGIVSQYTAATDGRFGMLINQSEGGLQDPNSLNVFAGGTGGLVMSVDPLSVNVWHHIVLTRDGSNNAELFVDGVSVDTDTGLGGIEQVNFIVGDLAASGLNLQGFVDEIRASNIQRSDDWIEATYNITNAPATYLSEGDPVRIAGTTTTTTAAPVTTTTTAAPVTTTTTAAPVTTTTTAAPTTTTTAAPVTTTTTAGPTTTSTTAAPAEPTAQRVYSVYIEPRVYTVPVAKKMYA